MDSRLNGQEADVIQFGRDASKPDRDQLDAAGQTILQLIHRAAGFAEENSRHALPYSPSTDYTCDDLRSARLTPWLRPELCSFPALQVALRAILLASSTVTSMRGLRASICSSHEPFGAPRLLA